MLCLRSWSKINAEVPQWHILGLLLILIYNNDLFNALSLNVKLFTNETSLFWQHITSVQLQMNWTVTKKINDWNFQWKMSCNLCCSKQAQEIIFSRKLKKTTYPSLTVNLFDSITSFESLQLCCWFRKLFLFTKLSKVNILNIFLNTISVKTTPYTTMKYEYFSSSKNKL